MHLDSLLQRAAAASLAGTRKTASGGATELPPGPCPQFYTEDQLHLPQTAELRKEGVPGIVGDLLRARSSEERQQLMRGVIAAIGFDWLSYGTVTLLRGHWWPLSMLTTYANPEWIQRYFAQRHHEVDLRQPEVPVSGLPLVWDLEQIEAAIAVPVGDPQLTARHQRFADDLRASGIHSGLVFRLASPTHTNQYTVISLHSGESGRRWITAEVIGQALTLGLSLHEYVSRHTRMPGESGAARIEISSTQQYILQQLLQGRSDKEIASRLDLSAHTVDYHMRQLRRRFAARNRVQLVNAVQHGESDFGVLSEM